jgi:hypothetical protein
MSDLFRDRMHCIMPRNRELQFAMMPVLQSFLQDFCQRMALGVAVREETMFELEYSLDLPSEDLEFFSLCGLVLPIAPNETVSDPDIVLDFHDERLLVMKDSGKNCSSYAGMLAGVSCSGIPVLRTVKPRLPSDQRNWGFLIDSGPGGYRSTSGCQTIDPEVCMPSKNGYCRISGEDLMRAGDGQYTGVVGRAGWETYLAISMGLPVIEVLPEGRHRNWLSKFHSPVYRCISGRMIQTNPKFLVQQAIVNLEAVIEYLAKKETEKQQYAEHILS